MITNISQLDLDGTYTYADYVTWRFTELVELIRGHVVKMAAPKTAHQRISLFLTVEIGSFLRKKPCNLFAAPFDVRLLTNPEGRTDREIYTVVQPDLCIICDNSKIDERGAIGSPDWIIEITSPSTFNHDRFTKRDLYEAHGVREYWIVYPNEKIIEVYHLTEEGIYSRPQIFSQDENSSLSPHLFPDLAINLHEMFD